MRRVRRVTWYEFEKACKKRKIATSMTQARWYRKPMSFRRAFMEAIKLFRVYDDCGGKR